MSNIFEERTAFNFYRSYYDVFLLLPDDSKLEFIKALLKAQFEGDIVDPQDTHAIFAFRSQMHSIKKQVEGFEKGKKTYPDGNPTKGKDKGKGKQVQEKEEEEEKEEGKEEDIFTNPAIAESIDFDKLVLFINQQTGRKYRTINNNVKRKFNARLKEGYTKEDILNAIRNAVKMKHHKDNGCQFLTPEFFSRDSTLEKYSSKSEPKRAELGTAENPIYNGR